MSSENKTATKSAGLMDYIKTMGPALIVSALVVGPGSVTTASSMGASYRYVGVWLVIFACLASYFYQETALRIVIHKENTVLGAVREAVNPGLSKLCFILAYIMTICAQAGNFIGAGMAMNYFVPQLSTVTWASLIVVLALALVFTGKDGLMENFTKILILIMVVSFVITAFASKPDVGLVLSEGFSFQIPGGQWMLALALVGTTMVADTPLALSTLNREKYCVGELAGLSKKEKTSRAKFDLIVSLVVTGCITMAILICSATVLNPKGITVSTAADMAIQLTPVLGQYAGILFSLGLWAAAFSSGIYRINLMPRYYRDAWDLNEATDAKTKKTSALIQLMAGVIPFFILVIWGSNPVTLVILAQTVVGILLPIITIVLLVLMNNKKYLGDKANNIPQNIALFITAAVTLAMTARTFINLFAMF